jgi:hypothetical protein
MQVSSHAFTVRTVFCSYVNSMLINFIVNIDLLKSILRDGTEVKKGTFNRRCSPPTTASNCSHLTPYYQYLSLQEY